MTKTQTTIAIGAVIAAWLVWGRKLTPSVTTSEGFDMSQYGGPTIYPEPIKAMARAIARQEGFYITGSIPQRAHNPGDLKMPGWTGPTLGSGISVFESDDAGWNALYRQLWLIVTGQSSHYHLDMTIADMGQVWTSTQQSAWSTNVSNYLGVPDDTPLWSVLA